MLRSLVGGSIMMPAILNELLASQAMAGTSTAIDPLAPRSPHFKARAKRVIFLYMSGGCSHVDSFDYKPKLFADHSKPVKPGKFLKRPDWKFKPRGTSGT